MVTAGRFPALDAATKQRSGEVTAGSHNRGTGQPGIARQGPLQAVVTMGCMAADDEAFGTVKPVITRRANNVALATVDDAQRVDVTRLADR